MIQKKLCMVGVFATGKTSLVRRFVEGRFSDKYLSTVGVKIDRKPVRAHDRDVNLLLWDLEGRDSVSDIQVSYLRGAAAVLYVADGTRRETLDQVTELREIVDAAIGPRPSALAVNKADLLDQWTVTSADISAFRERQWHVITTSAKTGDGVEGTFTWLAERAVAEP